MHFANILLLTLTTLLPTLTLTVSAAAEKPPPPTTLSIIPTNETPISCTRKSRKGDSISVHYRGTIYADDTQFDASYDRGAPLTFELGSGRVIQGWDQGLVDMCIGEKRTLTIPPELGYGDRGVGPIPGGATLVFETELMGIKGVTGKDEL